MLREVAARLSVERPLEQEFRLAPVPIEHGLGACQDGQRIPLAFIHLQCASRRSLCLWHRLKRSIHGKHAKVEPCHCHSTECQRIARAARSGLFEALDGAMKLFSCLTVQVMTSSKVPFVCFEIIDAA